jgi:D-inositol-3-phosphate glycosyltransferase
MTRRIAIISEHASPLGALGGLDSGGQNVYVGQLARRLAAMGHSVDVFTRRDDASLPEIINWEDGARVINVPAGPARFIRKEELLPLMPDFTDYILDFIGRAGIRYDVIHANFFMSGLVAAEIKRALDIPFVITFHALGRVRRLHQREADLFPDERFEIEDRLIAEADHIIAECPQDEDDLLRLYNADPVKVSVIPCGFDATEMYPVRQSHARAHLGFAPDEKIILQLGRMAPRKGLETVIRAFALFRKAHGLAARLVIVGGEADEPDPRLTPEIGRLQKIAAEEGVSEQITFTGRRGRDELKYFYSAADVFVTVPWYEPFGITPVEAMACGTPVIGSNVGGIKFSVSDGETGFLVPPKDPRALAGKLAELFRQPELLKRLSHFAIERANQFFTWEKVTTALAAVFEEVLEMRCPACRHKAGQLALVDQCFEKALVALRQSRRKLRYDILTAAEMIAECFDTGGKLLVCGNGGSAADAQHFAAEFVGRFKREGRAALPVLALNAETAFLTAWSNDYGYEQVFARQVEAFGRAGDLLVGISTSGRSRNLLAAFDRARQQGVRTLAVLGRDGGALRESADLALVVPADETQHIQEAQMVVLHLLCELVEECYPAQRDESVAIRAASFNGYAQAGGFSR